MSSKMTADEAASVREAISEYESWGSLVAKQIAANLRSILDKFGPKSERENARDHKPRTREAANMNDTDLLAAEVRRLQAVIAAGEPTLTDEEREAVARSIDECVATAGLANDRATIDAADRAAATLRSLLQRLGGTSE